MSVGKQKSLGRPARVLAHTRVAVMGLALTVIASSVVACSADLVSPEVGGQLPPQAVHDLGPLDHTSVGSYHNAFLDFALPKIRKAVRNGGGRNGACRAVAQSMREFVVAYRINADPRRIRDDLAGHGCGRGSHGPTFSIYDDGIASAEFNGIVTEMETAVEAEQPVSELAPLFEQKVAYAYANLPYEEAEILAAGASVGLSSVEYWDANYVPVLEGLREEYAVADAKLPGDAWLLSASRSADLLAPPPSPLFWRAAAARVGKADLKGAIHGGINGIRGGWSGVLAGALIEGGGKSAGALIAEAFQ